MFFSLFVQTGLCFSPRLQPWRVNPDKTRCWVITKHQIHCFYAYWSQCELCVFPRCQNVYYCSSECQRANWPSHKKFCKKLKLSALDRLVEWLVFTGRPVMEAVKESTCMQDQWFEWLFIHI